MKYLRFITGYLIGVTLFAIFIPYILILVSEKLDPSVNVHLINHFSIRLWVSLPVFCLGLLFAVWSNISLFFVGKGGPTDVFNVAISPRSLKLVVTGPYRFSRNPMVFGAMCIYFSIAVFINSFTDLIFLVVLIPLIILYLKKTEEKRLTRDFGDEFLRYKASVAMVVPFLKIRKKYS